MQSISLDNIFKNVSLLMLVIITVSIFLIQSNNALAQVGIPAAGVDLDGYAWSENIGWISMNCRTGSATGGNICGASNYKVTLLTGGQLTGYAWSSNIGWISFGKFGASSGTTLTNFPTGGGTTPVSASVTGTYPSNIDFVGWVRACAGTVPGDCSSMVSRTDGWDGWISLKGVASNPGLSPYGVEMSTTGGIPNTFAWGSSVVGWIDFDQIGFLSPTAILSGTGCQIALGASSCNGSFSWNITNASLPKVRNITTNNEYSSGVPSATNTPYSITFGPNVVQARDNTTVINPPGDVIVTGTCPAGADFASGTCQPIVLPAPLITIKTNRVIVRSGETVSVIWSLTPSPVASGSCTITGPGMPSSAITISGNQNSTNLGSKTRFSITCTGPFGTVSTSTQVELIPAAKEV